MDNTPVVPTIAVGDFRIAPSPTILPTLVAPSCFGLTFYDPISKIGGLAHLKAPSVGNELLGHYDLIVIQRLLAEMHGAGAVKDRLAACIVPGSPMSSATLRTIAATLRWQGIKPITVNALPELPVGGNAGRQIRFSLADGEVAVQDIVPIYQELQAKTNEMQAILQGIGDGIIVTDPQLRLVMANPAARRLLNLAPEVQAGHYLPADLPLSRLLASRSAQGAKEETSFVDEIQLSDPESKKSLVCQAMVSRIMDGNGHAQGIVAVLRDITAQREMDKLKSNLLSVVSHELRTPLHSISGFVDIILMGKTGEVTDLQRDFLSTVKQQAAQLQTIINDLLEFSRLEYGPIKLTTEPVHLAAIAESVCRKLAPLAENQITLVNAVPQDLPVFEGDSVRLEQVLTNLVDNALKFTPAGGKVMVGAADLDQEIEFWVADTGIGIPPTEQAKVFEKFYQVANGSSAKRRGAGLGLSICKHIVEQHQGRIWVESELGQGSTFRVILPKSLPGKTGLARDLAELGNDLSLSKQPAPVPELVRPPKAWSPTAAL